MQRCRAPLGLFAPHPRRVGPRAKFHFPWHGERDRRGRAPEFQDVQEGPLRVTYGHSGSDGAAHRAHYM
jgi:hypothetical protein